MIKIRELLNNMNETKSEYQKLVQRNACNKDYIKLYNITIFNKGVEIINAHLKILYKRGKYRVPLEIVISDMKKPTLTMEEVKRDLEIVEKEMDTQIRYLHFFNGNFVKHVIQKKSDFNIRNYEIKIPNFSAEQHIYLMLIYVYMDNKRLVYEAWISMMAMFVKYFPRKLYILPGVYFDLPSSLLAYCMSIKLFDKSKFLIFTKRYPTIKQYDFQLKEI